MKDQFVPFELAVKLKELGFDEPCLGYYTELENLVIKENVKQHDCCEGKYIAPLWQQASEWFREKHNLFCKIDFFQSNEFEGLDYDYSIFDLSKPFKEDGITDNPLIDYSVNETYYFKYEEARQACLAKLIELVTEDKIIEENENTN